MAATLGRVVSMPVRSTAGRAGSAVNRAASGLEASVTRLTAERAGVVDDWGRDPGLVRSMLGLARVRWDVTVGGDQHLPRRGGALILVNTRRLSLTPIFSAFAISEAVDRPVRFVGRPDIAPVGAFARRIGGLLDHPDEVAGALAAGELVVAGAEPHDRRGETGVVDHALVGAALAAGVRVFPAATSSSPFSRSARVEIGTASRRTRTRRGPLAEYDLAARVRTDIDDLLDEIGQIRTGTPLDWLPLDGLGGA